MKSRKQAILETVHRIMSEDFDTNIDLDRSGTISSADRPITSGTGQRGRVAVPSVNTAAQHYTHLKGVASSNKTKVDNYAADVAQGIEDRAGFPSRSEGRRPSEIAAGSVNPRPMDRPQSPANVPMSQTSGNRFR